MGKKECIKKYAHLTNSQVKVAEKLDSFDYDNSEEKDNLLHKFNKLGLEIDRIESNYLRAFKTPLFEDILKLNKKSEV